MSNARSEGEIRLIHTANNKELLASSETLSTNDIAAIIDRILFVSCGPDAAAFLRTVDVAAFVQGDAIAKHALHLAQTRKVVRGHRFLVAGESSELHRALTTSSGLRSAVCHWLVSYLLQPKKIDSARSLLVRVKDGELLASTRGLIEHWTMYK